MVLYGVREAMAKALESLRGSHDSAISTFDTEMEKLRGMVGQQASTLEDYPSSGQAASLL